MKCMCLQIQCLSTSYGKSLKILLETALSPYQGRAHENVTSPFSGCIFAMISFARSSRLPITHSLQGRNNTVSFY